MDLRVAVTGSSGFIGQHLVRNLVEAGHQVIAIDKIRPDAELKGVSNRRCDLLDPAAVVRILKDARPHHLVHLAAMTDLDRSAELKDYAANTTGVANLLKAIKEAGTVRRAVCVSSQLVCQLGYTPRHDSDYNPTTVYGQSKVGTEQLWRDNDGARTHWCIVRPTTIWGPGMSSHYVRFFRMIRDGRYFHVGRKPIRKSYGYVGNAVQQLRSLLASPKEAVHRRVFYLADYEPISLEDWSDAFQRELGAASIRRLPMGVARTAAVLGDAVNRAGLRSYPFNSFRLRNVLTSSVVDTEPLRSVCRVLPYTMEAGVVETAAWLQSIWNGGDLGPGYPAAVQN
jgi:nucleoside-diphosphate-sugar epimerase